MVRGGRDKEKDASGSEALDMELVSDILWAINKIKAQKQRPSDDHICKVVESRTGQSRKEIAKQMELAVKAGHVIKVPHVLAKHLQYIDICIYRLHTNRFAYLLSDWIQSLEVIEWIQSSEETGFSHERRLDSVTGRDWIQSLGETGFSQPSSMETWVQEGMGV